eukprot:7286795-Lingulodinium_polyedra.AAC.1
MPAACASPGLGSHRRDGSSATFTFVEIHRNRNLQPLAMERAHNFLHSASSLKSCARPLEKASAQHMLSMSTST